DDLQRWAEVDLGAIADNVRTVVGLLPSGVKLFAVVKAGGYGHGARPAATAALAGGAYGLGVATVAEAIEVRDLCPHDRILVMGGLLPQEAPAAVESGAALTVSSLSLALALERAADRHRVQVHLKIDTGMGRFGCPRAARSEPAGPDRPPEDRRARRDGRLRADLGSRPPYRDRHGHDGLRRRSPPRPLRARLGARAGTPRPARRDGEHGLLHARRHGRSGRPGGW